MSFPAWINAIPPIQIYDPLAELLGATDGAPFLFRYEEAVKLAGHSCPIVAGAWLMAVLGLKSLFGDEIPVRGSMRVELRKARSEGTAGVTGAILGLVTGAAAEEGFKGLSGLQARCNLLRFSVDIPTDVRISRMDTETGILLDYHPERIPAPPEIAPLMAKVMDNTADQNERNQFAQLWQERVRRILQTPPENLIAYRAG